MKSYKVQTFYFEGKTRRYRITEKAIRDFRIATGKSVYEIATTEELYTMLWLCSRNELDGLTCTEFVMKGQYGLVLFRSRKNEYKLYEFKRLLWNFAKEHIL